MATLNESNYISDLLKWEAEKNLTRKNVTVVAATALQAGTVLGIKTADGKYYPSVAGASDGTQTAVAVLMEPLAITAGAVVPVIRRAAIVSKKYLVFDASYDTQPEKDAAYLSLENASMIVAAEAI